MIYKNLEKTINYNYKNPWELTYLRDDFKLLVSDLPDNLFSKTLLFTLFNVKNLLDEIVKLSKGKKMNLKFLNVNDFIENFYKLEEIQKLLNNGYFKDFYPRVYNQALDLLIALKEDLGGEICLDF